jgi:hypothetical protein
MPLNQTELLDKIVKEFLAHPSIARAKVSPVRGGVRVMLYDLDDNHVATGYVDNDGTWSLNHA